jgi:hypothetical protein
VSLPLSAPDVSKRWTEDFHRLGRFWRRRLALAVVLLFGGLVLAWRLGDNFRTVIPGLVYRSAQLSASTLRDRILQYHLRCVVNLRGPNVDDAWYQDERTTAVQFGAQPIDLSTDSGYPPNPEELRELVTLLTTCPKPVLVHCNSGVDRSGIVAAICVLALDEHGTLDKARQQFGLAYGQLPWRANTLRHKAFLALYEDWLAQTGYLPTPTHFREWAFHVYQPPADLDNRLVPGSPQSMLPSSLQHP